MSNLLVAAWMFLLGCCLKSNAENDNEYSGGKTDTFKRKKQSRVSTHVKEKAVRVRQRRRKIREKTYRTVHKIRTGRRF